MLNLIGALDKPTSGTLLIDGVDISTLNDNQLAELRLKIGFVFQFFNLIPQVNRKRQRGIINVNSQPGQELKEKNVQIELLKPWLKRSS